MTYNTRTVSSDEDGRGPLPQVLWRQQIFVSGETLALIERTTNFVRSSHNVDGIVIRGDGPYIPHIIGPDWVIGCAERRSGDAQLDDITSLVKALLGGFLICEIVLPDGIEEFMAWVNGDDE